MKTIVTKTAKTIDKAIPDMTKDVAIEKAKHMAKSTTDAVDCIGIAICMFGLAQLCIGAAAIDIAEVGLRSAKTTVKAGIVKYSEYVNPKIIRR